MAPDDRHLIEVFHGVYRRDRQRATSRGKCPVPNSQQLREMQELLRDRHCIFTSNAEILAALNRVAQLLRQYDIWSSRESLEVYQPDSGDYITRRDLPVDESNDAIASEEAELLDFIRDSLQQALENAIAQASNIRIAKLTKSKKYRPYADKFLTGLKLYYAEEMSLKEITPLLGLGNWDRARRVLNPGEFLSSVRTQTILQTWLNERIPERKIARHHEGQTHHLQIGDFTLTAIAVEHLWDETVRIFQHQLAYPTHFYGVVEVVEEEEEIIFRGLMRRDRLDDYLAEYEQPGNGVYSLPLSLFDPEPNHLITYCQHLSPEAIPLPAIAVESEPEPAIGITPTKLTRWLQDSFISGWKTLENLLDPRFNVAFNTRSIDREYVRGKLIDVGLEMKHITMTLLIAVKEEDEKLKTKVQLYPSSTQQYLPASVQLSLLSRTGKTLQSIQARERDNLIQLKPFKGKSGTRFSLEVALDDARIVEEFEL